MNKLHSNSINRGKWWLLGAALVTGAMGNAAFAFDTPATSAPAAAPITLRDFKLVGDLKDDRAGFTLTATAKVEDPKGGTLDLLYGAVALTEVSDNPRWRLAIQENLYVLKFDRRGEFPIQIKFDAAVRQQSNGWNFVDFHVAPAALQPIVLGGLGADTQFQFLGAARPERTGEDFASYLPADGTVKLAWKEAKKEQEGRLFYAAEMLSQISVSPGLMRQVALIEFKVMQGELNKVSLLLHGAGEVTRVQGSPVLSWSLEPVTNSTDRRLVVQLNQAQKESFALQVQMQTPLAQFPQSVDTVRLRPEGATRFAGTFRIVNEGAVRLEVAQSAGLSQISPEQFPETDATRALFRASGAQRFAYRFSSADFSLRIQADQILPELGVSQVLAYRLGENEQVVDAEIELDIREAPLRELLIYVPRGYNVVSPSAPGSSDFFVSESATDGPSELRFVYGQPVSGRQVIQLHLERNQALGTNSWVLPRLEVAHAKSVRGHVGVAADAGFRLTPERTVALTDLPTAFFPRRVNGLQSAFRLNDPAWEATLHVERLPQTVQADAFHLFSIGESIAYGSSVINYMISGAPISAFRIELSDEYPNVEFTGKDVRNWSKTNGGYVVQLHTPVSGAYTLLATYERPFKPKGETLAFTGARPLDAQSEQGHTLVISAYQFKVTPGTVSPSLLELEPGEVPAEYRLFFDAPILKAYRYTSRPFNLSLALSLFAQGESISQVVDRASLTNRISKEGQVLMDARYFVKSRGNPHFKLTLPDGMTLWAATVNGAAVVPVKAGKASLIPLPQRADPNAVLIVDLTLASQSANPERLTLAAPKVAAPVMLAEWKLEPDAGRRLVFYKGSLTPVGGILDVSGFAGLARAFKGPEGGQARFLLAAMAVLVGISVVAWRWAGQKGVARFSARHLAGLTAGVLAFGVAVVFSLNLVHLAGQASATVPRELSFLAPVQLANDSSLSQPANDETLRLEVGNVPAEASMGAFLRQAWPALLALALWAYGWLMDRGGVKFLGWVLGWTALGWAALRCTNGAPAFVLVLLAFLLLHVALPALRRLAQMPLRSEAEPPPAAEGGRASAVVALLLGGLVFFLQGCKLPESSRTDSSTTTTASGPSLPQSVHQQIRVEEKFVLATAKIHWRAEKGQSLPLVRSSAVLTRLNYPTRDLRLVAAEGSQASQELRASRSGVYDIELEYQLQLSRGGSDSGFSLPTWPGLVNQLQVTLANLDVDVFSAQAVSVQRSTEGTNTVANLVLSPLAEAWIGWKPRSRDLKREKPVFYAEIYQLYAPSAGVIEGSHYASIRPAQGELSELVFQVPSGATITDVIDPTAGAAGQAGSLLSLWRFDPDTRKLRVNLSSPQSRPFAVVIRSQFAVSTLPFEHTVGLLSVENSAGQVGFLGLATGNEVQLEDVKPASLSAINLEDFPGVTAQPLQTRIPGLTVRRAFRYMDTGATATVKAAAVEPDVRVETQGTLSLSEDRTSLGIKAAVEITRAGIFRLSFVLPAGLDVEAVSGAALSHWTELKSDAGRVITLHLKGKTEGQQEFAISLAGSGMKATNGWTVPQVVIREASKQRGTLVLAPEQGMRLQVASRDGVTQLDPQQSGIRQKGVLAFRILQTPWKVVLDVEQVDPWIQVTGLQHATVNEAQIKVAANLQYQIENTGLKAFHVLVPTNAEGVRFQGDQVADFMKLDGPTTNGLQEWEVKLQRRVIGQYLLQLNYQVLIPEQAAQTSLRGVQAADVNVQRGFVTVQSSGRLQVTVDAPAAALQPTEYQSIPRTLQLGLQAASANFAYRLIEPAFDVPLKLDRHEAARLLSARVENITFTSVISDDGVMLTQARLELLPGDKRLLELTLPKGAQFWFAFVNQNGVWPWKSNQDTILIPLEQQARGGKSLPVEFFFSSRIGPAGARALDLDLLAPSFDLPLENITWRVHLNDKWRLTRWAGDLQLQSEVLMPPAVSAIDAATYLKQEAGVQRQKTQEAEQMLSMGNSLLQNGEPTQARRAFQSAYGLSQGDDAFNEDARVQLNNLKLQQALVGLNVRQAAVTGESGALGGKLRDLRARKDAAYTQQDAKDIIDRNTADDNTAFMRVAERLIQQQDLAVSSPAAIHASVPDQGRVLTFKRAVLVDSGANLKIRLGAGAARAASWGARVLILGGTLAALAILAWATGPFRKQKAEGYVN